MKKSFLSLIFALAGFGALTTSCEDMLTPEIDRYAENFSGKDTVNFYFGILRNLQGMVEQNVLLGELRGDLVTTTEYTSDSIHNIMTYGNTADGTNDLLNRAAYYKVINQCNFYLAKVDSMALRNNSYYMRRELAQVELVRAWIYLQLVQQYGSVPFITDPVTSASTGWETHPPLGFANPENLLSLLEQHGKLKQAYNYSNALGYINYPNFNTGNKTFDQRLTVFNADLIYGDLYLLRGKTKADYEAAADHYRKFLDLNKYSITEYARAVKINNNDAQWEGLSNWYRTYDKNNVYGDAVTAVPSASNRFFGKVLTRIPQVYGFDPRSVSSRQSRDNADNTTTVSTVGAVSVSPNEKNRQVAPSNSYLKLNENQTFVYVDYEPGSNNERVKELKYPNLGDLRARQSAPIIQTQEGNLVRFIQKFNPPQTFSWGNYLITGFQFSYGIRLYSLRGIYLKYAEAINRAGYPRMAFDVLRSGLDNNSMPVERLEFTKSDTIYTDASKTTIDTIMRYVAPALSVRRNGDRSIDLSTLKRAEGKAYLNFETFGNRTVMGIHAAGSGVFNDADTVWVYDKVVAKRMVEEAARMGQTIALPKLSSEVKMELSDSLLDFYRENADGTPYVVRERYYNYVPNQPLAAEIAAVETLIADEMALETAFEGNRMFDLMRIQRHRNNAGDEKVENSWLAWLISRRDFDVKPYEKPLQTGPLYNRLLIENNWYFPAPKAGN